jgi:hypothetical protein
VLAVWSGTRPRLDTHRVPARGRPLGRDLADPADDRISRTHARVTTSADGDLFVTDLASRNGTYVFGQQITATNKLVGVPAIVRGAAVDRGRRRAAVRRE